MVKRTTSRRRERSIRIRAALIVLGAATLLALLALVLQSRLGLSLALTAALAAGYTATRLACAEVLQARREGAAELARQGAGYRELAHRRAAENAQITADLSRQVQDREQSILELEGTIRLADLRASIAESRTLAEMRRADEAEQLLAELREADGAAGSLAGVPSREDLAWDDSDLDTVVDLLDWEAKVTAHQESTYRARHA